MVNRRSVRNDEREPQAKGAFLVRMESFERPESDKALVPGEPLRNIAERVSISPESLLRHKSHVSQAIEKASEKREEKLGESLLDQMQRVQRKAWEMRRRTPVVEAQVFHTYNVSKARGAVCCRPRVWFGF